MQMGERASSNGQRLVSVVVPTHNRPAMLRQALASIRAIEGPDLAFQILVGDNGDAPETPSAAEQFGATYIKVALRGACASRNACLRAATGEFIAFLDDDDVWLPGNIRPHIAVLDARPEIEAVIGQVIYTDYDLTPTSRPMPAASPGEGDDLLRRMLGDFFPQVATTVIRASISQSLGEFQWAYDQAEDVDWFLRLARRRKVAFVETACILFRGRASGSFDAIQRKRIKAGRRVFFRHAIPEWRIWKSPRMFFRAYTSRLIHFYIYFADAAETRSAQGLRGEALGAMLAAGSVFPLRAVVNLFKPSPMHRALRNLITRGNRADSHSKH
jgi:glycosyltransferase involved in cell wall biosynthesis